MIKDAGLLRGYEKTVEDLYNTQISSNKELQAMLSIIDPEHSIIVDENIGLIGEFEGDSINKEELKPVVKSIYDNIKCGDYYQVVGSQGLIVLEEKVIGTYRILSPDGKATSKYVFILKDFLVLSILDDMLGDEPDNAIVVYDADKDCYETNCKDLMHKYKYVDNLDLNSHLGTSVYYNDETLYCLDINIANHIGILRAY